ncbi:MAG: YfiR family protein [Nitrospinae bacterium]|nr:YfiR family protein [Nitrospinota bacterium]
MALLLFISVPSGSSFAQEGNATREAQVKTAFIYNFSKFTTWPDRAFQTLPNNLFPVCLVGSDPLGKLLGQLAKSKTITDRTILFQSNPPQHELGNCRILYISSSESSRLDKILKSIAGHPVLTVGNSRGYAKRGVGINLFEKGGRLRFEINHQAILKSGLTLSSELLVLGVLVKGEN